ncbi:MAG: sensor histidine kinase, partial [Syntrophobacterales bacterium]
FVLKQMLATLERWFGDVSNGASGDGAGAHEKGDVTEYRSSEGIALGHDGSSPIDRSVLSALQEVQIEGEPSIVKRVVDAYLTDSEPLISQLKEALSVSDREVLQRSAHSLKSSSANVGALRLSEMSRELEMNCKNNSLEDAARLVASIGTEFMKAKESLQKEGDLQ